MGNLDLSIHSIGLLISICEGFILSGLPKARLTMKISPPFTELTRERYNDPNIAMETRERRHGIVFTYSRRP